MEATKAKSLRFKETWMSTILWGHLEIGRNREVVDATSEGHWPSATTHSVGSNIVFCYRREHGHTKRIASSNASLLILATRAQVSRPIHPIPIYTLVASHLTTKRPPHGCPLQAASVALTSGQLMPLSAAPAFPSPAQPYRPTGLLAVALMYWRSMHSSVVFFPAVSSGGAPPVWGDEREKLTRARSSQGDAPVGHDVPLLAWRGRVALG